MKRIYAMISGEPSDEQINDQLMPYFKLAMMDLYLGLSVEAQSTDDRIFTHWNMSPVYSASHSREQMEQQIQNITVDLRRIKRSANCLRRVHIQTQTGEVYMELDNNTEPYSECNLFTAYVLRISEKEKFAEFSITTIKLNPGKDIVEMQNPLGCAASFFEGGNANGNENMIWNKFKVPHPGVLSAIADGLHAIRKNADKKDFLPPEHTKMFGKLMEFVVKEATDEDRAYEKVMTTYGTSEQRARSFSFSDCLYNDIERVDLGSFNLDPFDYPYLDLSTRDVKWIIDYATPQIKSREFDHLAAINSCNYGQSFRFQLGFHLGGRNERFKLPVGTATYEENQRGQISIQIREELIDQPGTAVLLKGFYESIDDFPNCPQFITVSALIDYRATGYLPLESDFLAGSVLFNSNLVHLVGYLNYVMCVLIVLHDRPTKYVRIKQFADGSEPTKPKKRNSTSPQPRKLVAHILKTKYQANKLMQSIAGTKMERNYYVESWSRCAHTRRLKDGRTIDVRASECHRKKPLHRREVILKL